MDKSYEIRLLKTLKTLLSIDDIEIIKCVIESSIEEIEERHSLIEKVIEKNDQNGVI